MRILYICQYFPPEPGAPSARASELGKYWSRAGHDVTILTGFPNHPNGVVPEEYRKKMQRLTCTEHYKGAEIVRTWLAPLPNRKSWERIINYGSFFLSSTIRGLFLRKPDVLVATSPQLLVGLAGLIVARLRGIPYVFEVRDLWPESLAAVGVSNEKSLLNRILGKIAGLLYRHADHIVVVTPAFKEYLNHKWNVPESKLSVVMNGVDTELFSKVPDEALKPDGEFWVSYIGTIGNAHGLDTVLKAARRLGESHPHIKVLVVGDGAERGKIEEMAKAEGLENLRILGPKPRAEIPGIIGASDVCLVLLKRSEVFKTVLPTKLFEFMACARPVVLGVEGQAKQLLETAGAGIAIPPEDANALYDAVIQLHNDRALRNRLGDNGCAYAFKFLSRATSADFYAGICAQLAGKRNAAAEVNAESLPTTGD